MIDNEIASENAAASRRRRARCATALLVLGVWALASCTQPTSSSRNDDDGGGDEPNPSPVVLPDWGDSHYQVVDAVAGSAPVTLPPSMAGRYLLYVATNATGQDRLVSLPSLQPISTLSDELLHGGGDDRLRALRGRPGQFDHPPLLPGAAVSAASVWDVAATEELRTEDGPVAARVDAVRSQDGWTLYVWRDVAADAPPVTSEMTDAVADAFLIPSADDDIFGIMSGVFGVPWGAHDVSNVISPTRRDIHVLLYDIENDGVPGFGESRTVGYFWSRDNFRRSSYPESNERLMFYLDSALLADTENKDGSDDGVWSRDDYWPEEAISTLAHEFQHMIHFYRRPVMLGSDYGYDTWLDELMAMAAEELVARAIQVDGPRGVAWSDGSAGAPGNRSGRMRRYNDVGYRTPLATWYAANPLDDYAASYSFGAFLIRVYGAPILTELIAYSGEPGPSYSLAAVAAAASAVDGTTLSAAEILRRWGTAVLVSDDTTAPADVRINTGTWIGDGNPDSVVVGSINAYNYRTTYRVGTRLRSFDGPRIVSASAGPYTVTGTTNLFAAAGTVPDGGGELLFDLPPGVVVTAIVR